MARVDLLSQHPDDPEAAALFAQVREARGADWPLPDLYRVLGRAPAMFEAWLAFAWPLRNAAKTSRKLRELVILRGALVSGTVYEWSHHRGMAADAGVTDAQVDALPRWRDATCFDATERAVLRLADEVTTGPAASAAAIDELKAAGFDEPAVVELVLTASFYVCVSRFLRSMDVGLEPGYEAVLPTPG